MVRQRIFLDVHDWIKDYNTEFDRIELARPVATGVQTRLMRRTHTKHLEFIAEWGSEMERAKEHSCLATGCLEELTHHICMMDIIQDV
jgi:hypothetical protein